jgi:hypothetical protein
MRMVNAAAGLLARSGTPLHVRGSNAPCPGGFRTSEQLVRAHFEKHCNPDHINFFTLLEAVTQLGGRPGWILETGSSAWGTDSSRLFDSYVSTFGGGFWSVDLRLQPMLKLRSGLSQSTTLYCDDSVRFLQRWLRQHGSGALDLVYLDSLDLDISDPVPSAVHGLREFFAIRPALKDGGLLLVDDTPASVELLPEPVQAAARDFEARYGIVPGKGMFIELYLAGRADVVKLRHHYQTLYRFSSHSSGAGPSRSAC